MFMNQEAIDVTKKFLSKMAKEIIKSKQYQLIDNVEVFFVFGSKYKTAMCDWVYGMKLFTKAPLRMRDELVIQLQMDIRKNFERFFQQSVCATDIIFEKDY